MRSKTTAAESLRSGGSGGSSTVTVGSPWAPLPCRLDPLRSLSGLDEGFIPLQPSRVSSSATSRRPGRYTRSRRRLSADISLQLKMKVSAWMSVIVAPPERCQTTDLAVGGSNPSRRATNTAGQRPCGRVADRSGTAGVRPNCDHIGGHSQPGCDHLRPPSPIPTGFMLISATVETQPVVDRALPALDRMSGPARWCAQPLTIDR
jgi:hypothetical protein